MVINPVLRQPQKSDRAIHQEQRPRSSAPYILSHYFPVASPSDGYNFGHLA
ncbi:MAG: hypothetical protein HC812_01425 [Leptolyngbya sp. RL_3_1]|nr:hypothetical protein [Leptolyngbya sp. RL_3_1]